VLWERRLHCRGYVASSASTFHLLTKSSAGSEEAREGKLRRAPGTLNGRRRDPFRDPDVAILHRPVLEVGSLLKKDGGGRPESAFKFEGLGLKATSSSGSCLLYLHPQGIPDFPICGQSGPGPRFKFPFPAGGRIGNRGISRFRPSRSRIGDSLPVSRPNPGNGGTGIGDFRVLVFSLQTAFLLEVASSGPRPLLYRARPGAVWMTRQAAAQQENWKQSNLQSQQPQGAQASRWEPPPTKQNLSPSENATLSKH
jgi:hypothetical protein